MSLMNVPNDSGVSKATTVRLLDYSAQFLKPISPIINIKAKLTSKQKRAAAKLNRKAKEVKKAFKSLSRSTNKLKRLNAKLARQ